MLRYPANVPTSILPAVRQYYNTVDQPYIQFMPDCARYDAKLTYTLKPGSCKFSAREFDTVVTVNSLGVRDDEQSLQAPAIAVLGDSVSMGWGVEDYETYASVIERETGIKVLNLAVSSYGTVREFDILNRVDASGVSTLIVQYSHNDMMENKTYIENGNHLPVMDEMAYEATRQKHLKHTRYFPAKHVILLTKRLAKTLFRTANEQGQDDEAEYFFTVLFTKFAEFSQKAKLAPHSTTVIVIGLHWPVEASRAAIGKLGPRPGAISRMFEIGHPEGPRSTYVLDQHTTPVGHGELAEQIIRIVRDKCYLGSDGVDGHQQGSGCDFFLNEL
jgi:hypothetical protein